MVSAERFKNFWMSSYRTKLLFLMKEAQKKKDIWLMLVIHDEIRKFDAEQTSAYLEACEKARL